jgi:hypothetical protein
MIAIFCTSMDDSHIGYKQEFLKEMGLYGSKYFNLFMQFPRKLHSMSYLRAQFILLPPFFKQCNEKLHLCRVMHGWCHHALPSTIPDIMIKSSQYIWDLMIHGYGRKLWKRNFSTYKPTLRKLMCFTKTKCPSSSRSFTVVKNMVHFLFVWCRAIFFIFMVPSIVC